MHREHEHAGGERGECKFAPRDLRTSCPGVTSGRVRSWEGLEVTVPHSRRARSGIRLHYLPLPHDEITIELGSPVTTVPRPLLDLAMVLREGWRVIRVTWKQLTREADLVATDLSRILGKPRP